MAFTVSEFRDLLQLLEQHPTWRAELRRWVLTEELLALPQTVRELAEIQRRTEEHIRRTEEHMAQLAVRMDEQAQRFDRLVIRIDDLTQRMEQMAETQLRMGSDLEQLKGYNLEQRYLQRAPAYFSRILRRVHALSNDELVDLLDEAVAQGHLSQDEADALLQADVVVRGRRREDGAEVYLVVEVSWGVGLSDVQRAAERATLLARLGTPALPVVAGFWITPEAQEPARALHVWQVTDGRVIPPEVAPHG